MSTRQKNEFESIVNEILNNNKFKELDNELHHGITRYGHSVRVAKATYKCTKAMKMDYKTATRAALLHDFFTTEDVKDLKGKENAYEHPLIAAENANNEFGINTKEKNIIEAHMFPLTHVMPKYKESWVVTCVDKGVALYEMYRFKCSLVISIWAIFFFNMITLQK